MRITGLTTRLLKIDCASRYRDGLVPSGRPKFWLYPLVTLHTDEGIEGLSMAYGPHGDGCALAELLHETYFPSVAGLDPRDSEAIWQLLWRRQRHLYNQSDTLLGVIDVAIWDIRGKTVRQPIAALLGQCRDRLPAYLTASSEAAPAEELAAEAARAQVAGYHGYKLQLRDGPARDIPRLRAVREATPGEFRLMQDPNAGYSFVDALRVGHVLDELAFHWFEEPLPETQIENYRVLVAALRTPILAAETLRLTGIPNFLGSRAMTMARGDVLIKGGITGLRKAMHACELFGIDLELHTANTPLLDVANLHIGCAARNTTMVEVHHPIFRFGLNQHPYDVGADGFAHLPRGDGLGVELDHDWVENHTESVRRSGTQ